MDILQGMDDVHKARRSRQLSYRQKLLKENSKSIGDQHLARLVKRIGQTKQELHYANHVFWLNKLENEIDNPH